jgi:hypothetical protein
MDWRQLVTDDRTRYAPVDIDAKAQEHLAALHTMLDDVRTANANLRALIRWEQDAVGTLRRIRDAGGRTCAEQDCGHPACHDSRMAYNLANDYLERYDQSGQGES